MRIGRWLKPFGALSLAVALDASRAVAAPSAASMMLRAEATRLNEAKRPDDAIEALKQAVQDSPDFVEAWTDLGNLLLAKPDYPAAAKAFSGALAVKPELGVARYNLAFALRKAGDLPRAAETYKVYLARQPDDADAWYGLAESLRGNGDAFGAAEAYDKYAALEKRADREAWVQKAKDQAAALRASRVDPEKRPAPVPPPPAPSNPTTKRASEKPKELLLAIDDLRARRFDAALVRLKPLALTLPEDPFVATALAGAYLGAGDSKRALALYQRALEKAPPEAKGAIALGLAEAARLEGDEDAAEAALETAKQSPNATVAREASARREAL
ncbi:MAG: tetratricopeptide repeat protein [Deltaproteobacteria bacterium]|nr:tetratricopeptide repeat protein [Deltaproteobacteria bacterium]